MTEGAILIFLQSGIETLLGWPGIEPTTLDLSSLSGACDLSAMATSLTMLEGYIIAMRGDSY